MKIQIFLQWVRFVSEVACFPCRGHVLALLAGTTGQTRERCKQQSPTDCEQQDWSGQGRGETYQGEAALGEHLLIRNPGPVERCSLKPFGVSPSLLSGRQGWCLSGCLSGSGGARQPVMATVGKDPVPEQANDARGQQDAHSSISLLSCRQTRVMAASLPCNRASSNLTQQGPSIISQ